MKAPSALLLALALAAPAAAQAVLVVDDDGPGTTSIQQAVDAAQPGDIVLVEPGCYEPFAVDGKSLIVHAAGPVRPVVHVRIAVRNLAPTDQVSVRGFDVVGRFTNLANLPPPIEVTGCAGPVWIEDVRVNETACPGDGPYDEGGALVSGSSSVTFARCLLRSGSDNLPFTLSGDFVPAGLRVVGSSVSVYDSELRGGRFNDPQGPPFESLAGAPALELDGGTAFVSGCVLAGGDGGAGTDFLFCLDCQGGRGGAAVWIDGGAVVTLVDSDLQGGLGGPSDDPATGVCQLPCAAGADGPASHVASGALDPVAGVARSAVAGSPVRDGELLLETFTGEPGDLVVLVYSPFHGLAGGAPGVVGLAVIGLPFFVQGLGLADASGQKVLAVQTGGFLDPSLEGVPIFTQAVFIDATLTPRIGSPSLLLLLSPSF